MSGEPKFVAQQFFKNPASGVFILQTATVITHSVHRAKTEPDVYVQQRLSKR
jgi:hypothetical protein